MTNQAPNVVGERRRQFSKWWPISFFIAAVIFIIIGGGLVGAWSANATCSRSSYSSSSYRYSYSCSDSALFYGGIACVAIGGICKLVAWILLIVFCVKRSRYQPVSVAYTYQPIDHYHAAGAAPPYQPAHAPAAAPHPPKEAAAMGARYCSHCGAAVTTPFCAQCGNRA
ncbi:hypothetical protein NEMBOFW57_004232 [Staphylotrichum longicolle]|uniref:Uncharacterized protein n=1 Tax=Staphylotrichum longicolle TaxID=669026 RepID=A0AAD4F601_9PEZI|nr:hypothetical protein NEMBOFW57_004232 [Staphylotrichum longicolle]